MMKRAVSFLLMCALIWLPLPAYPQNSEVIIIRRPKLGSSSHTFTHTSNYAYTTANSGSTITLTAPSNPSTTDLVIIGVDSWNNDSGTPPTVTMVDGASTPNTYTVVGSAGGFPCCNGYAFIGYLLSAPSSANKTITITFSNTIVYSAAFFDEFTVSGAGSPVLDGSPVTHNGSNALPVVPLTTGTNDLLYTMAVDNGSLSGVGTPWTGVGAGTSPIYAAAYYGSYIANAAASTAPNYTVGDPTAIGIIGVAIR